MVILKEYVLRGLTGIVVLFIYHVNMIGATPHRAEQKKKRTKKCLNSLTDFKNNLALKYVRICFFECLMFIMTVDLRLVTKYTRD